MGSYLKLPLIDTVQWQGLSYSESQHKW